MTYKAHESAIVDPGAKIGTGTRIWHFSHIMKSQIGENCTFGQNVFVGEGVSIGSHCKIQNNVSIYSGVTLEDYVFCGPNMVFTNVRNPRCMFPKKGLDDYATTLVKKGSSIGANATIVCGVTLGEHSFIAAGSTVTKDVPDYALIVGCPGRIKGWMSQNGEVLEFDQNNIAADSLGQQYTKISDKKVILSKTKN